MIENIKWLGQSGFRVITKSGKTIYIDPFKVVNFDLKADFIFITHSHYDHLSPEVIAKIRDDKTLVICPHDCGSKIGGRLKITKPNDKFEIDGIKVETVPAYNLDKEYHPKENNWVGYVLEVDGQRLYHAGDTDFIPEMKELKDIDIAMMPVSGTYVMNPDEAVEAINAFRPKKVIPMHFGDTIGSIEDAKSLKGRVEAEIVIMEPEK